MQTLNFVVIFVIICPQNVLTPHIFKGHFPIVSCNVHVPGKHLGLLNRAGTLHRGMHIQNTVQYK